MPVLIPTQKLLQVCNPFAHSPWDVPVTKRMVAAALRGPLDGANVPIAITNAPAVLHAKRIAFLVTNGWDDAIEVDVGIPSMRCYVDWPVLDGNHRLGAAAFRSDSHILASVGGDLDYALDLFGVECEEKEGV